MTTALSFEKINVGDELAPVQKTITQEKINAYAEASGDFNPIHIDPEFARNTIFGGTIAHGLLTLAYISEMMTRAFLKGWLKGGKLSVTFIAPVRPGDTIITRGKVLEKSTEGGPTVVCEVHCENQKGARVAQGKASASWPLGGPAGT
ncbi:MAG: MaoC family dehydratase [Chloroflexi bacterium]|nr:MaoC family dehydratase [Chloroflexota bacterium]